MGRKLLLLTLAAAAAAYVVSRLRSHRSIASENGNPLLSSDAVRRAIGAARQRIQADAESR